MYSQKCAEDSVNSENREEFIGKTSRVVSYSPRATPEMRGREREREKERGREGNSAPNPLYITMMEFSERVHFIDVTQYIHGVLLASK